MDAEQSQQKDKLQKQEQERNQQKHKSKRVSQTLFMEHFLKALEMQEETEKDEKKDSSNSSSSSNVHQPQDTTSSSSSSSSNKPIAFLIEGHTSCNDKSRFPEIVTTKELAQTNHCLFFDSVVNYDDELLSEAIKSKNERDQKILALSTFLAFHDEADRKDIIDQLIKSPYRHLLQSGAIKEIPSWVNNLDENTINSFAADVYKTYFDNDPGKFKLENQQLRKVLHTLSDKLSQQKFAAYLAEHKEITTIYGLIGKHHLSMFDGISKVISQKDGYTHVQISVESRLVNIHLFGGTHGESEHYQAMIDHVKANEQGFIIPETPKKSSSMDMASLLTLLGPISASRDSGSTHRDDSDDDDEDANHNDHNPDGNTNRRSDCSLQ